MTDSSVVVTVTCKEVATVFVGTKFLDQPGAEGREGPMDNDKTLRKEHDTSRRQQDSSTSSWGRRRIQRRRTLCQGVAGAPD